MEITDCFYIGYISKTRGLKGELQLFFEFENYKELDIEVLFIEIDKKLVPFFVENENIHNNSTAYIYLEDVDHIDKAQPLVRKKVYLPNTKLPERDPDDFRITDLKGFEVHDVEYGVLGNITEIHDFPQQHVAVVIYQTKEIMFPLNEDIMDSIDVENKILEVTLPEGLVDLYL